ncbi:MAG: hypothetical protein PS018_07625 [bacterium]|nr:hypothetical protein [bacterium]
MTRSKLFAAAFVLSAVAATPAMAQHVIDEPGMYAFYRPIGDLGIGSAHSPFDARALVPLNGDTPRMVRKPRISAVKR